MKVALYARVSTKDKGQDTENQLHQLREFCAKQGWTIVAEYVDQKSGKSARRSQFQAMFCAAARREFDLLLFWSLDRFSREGALQTMQQLQGLTALGVEWKSYTEQFLDSCGILKDAILALLAVFAKQERVRLSERTLAGLATARRAGRIGGRPKKIVDRGKIQARRAEGMTISAIAKEFDVSRGFIHKVIK